MKDQAPRATTPGPTPDESVAHVQATVATTAAEHQSAELLESMSLPTGAPGATDPAAAQAAELSHATEPGGGTGSTTPGAPPDTGGGEQYTVVRGDSLWKIAARHYTRGALWRGIYDANRAVIGSNSALIHPGQILTLPTLDTLITTSTHRPTVELAFSLRWSIEVARESGAARVPIDTFRRMHAQFLLLPAAHVQGTWQRLLHLNDSSGGYMGGGEFGLGEDAAAAGNEQFGTHGLALVDAAAAGDTLITLEATTVVGPGTGLTVGEGTAAEQVAITAVDPAHTAFTIDPALTGAHPAGTVVGATANVAREAPWLEAVVRHEIAHAIDGSLVDTTGFTNGLGGWQTTQSFDDWVALMGNGWATNDGTVITPDERNQIKAVIDGLRTAPSTAGLDDGLAPEHPIIKYWDKQVPVIEAAKPMASHGGDYWMHSGEYHGTNGQFFTINDYYQEFHSFNDQVQYNQVRSYATYSPAEFFAEIYSVYYEEAGTEGAVLGRFVPVAAWKSWIDANVNTAGAAPTTEGHGGPSRGKAAGVSH